MLNVIIKYLISFTLLAKRKLQSFLDSFFFKFEGYGEYAAIAFSDSSGCCFSSCEATAVSELMFSVAPENAEAVPPTGLEALLD